MNLFYLDENLDKCAEYHVDKHIVKMPLEVAQILCTSIWIDKFLGFVPRALNKEERDVLNEEKAKIKHLPPAERPITPYLPMMYNHPCTIWARSSLDNHEWTHCYGNALNDEYRYRYGKEHKSIHEVVNKLPEPVHKKTRLHGCRTSRPGLVDTGDNRIARESAGAVGQGCRCQRGRGRVPRGIIKKSDRRTLEAASRTLNQL